MRVSSRCIVPRMSSLDHVLGRRVHQIKFALMLHNVRNTWILPYTYNALAHVWVERRMGIRIHHVFQEVIGIVIVSGISWFDLKLPHCSYESFGAVQHIFVDGETIEGEFIFCVTILMNNLHLLYYRGFAAFSGTCL